MSPIGIVVGIALAGVLFALAAYFAWRQHLVWRAVRFETNSDPEQRRYLIRQCQRRYVGSFLLMVLAGMLVGSLFLDFNPEPGADRDLARRSLGYLSLYVIAMMLPLLGILVIAILDFWATARFSFHQQRQLLQEHQRELAADMMAQRRRSAELN